jgi:hypothetical protein
MKLHKCNLIQPLVIPILLGTDSLLRYKENSHLRDCSPLNVKDPYFHTHAEYQGTVPAPTDVVYIMIFVFYLDILMMDSVRSSETSDYLNETERRYIPEGCHLQISFT